jgi:hypothetical protein
MTGNKKFVCGKKHPSTHKIMYIKAMSPAANGLIKKTAAARTREIIPDISAGLNLFRLFITE